MNLAGFISPDRVLVPLEAESLAAAGWKLLDRLAAGGAVGKVEKLRRRVEEERPEDIVALADRAFILHYRTDAVSSLVVALGTSPTPICREFGEEGLQCARIVVLMVAPPRLAARYLQLLGGFVRFFGKSDRVERVLVQPDAQHIASLPAFGEFVLAEQLMVSDIMTARPRAVKPDQPLRDAALDMLRAGVGGLPVTDAGDRVIGMLSEKELMRHLLSSYLEGGAPQRAVHSPALGRRAVRDAMTRRVLCVSPEQPLAEVASIMTNKDVDRVPVVRDGRLVGVLTRGDIVRKLLGT